MAEKMSDQVHMYFEVLMNGGTLTQEISDELTYDTIHESEQNLWSILLMTGYLTKADPEEEGNTVELRIPNTEIAGIFEGDLLWNFFFPEVGDDKKDVIIQNKRHPAGRPNVFYLSFKGRSGPPLCGPHEKE